MIWMVFPGVYAVLHEALFHLFGCWSSDHFLAGPATQIFIFTLFVFTVFVGTLFVNVVLVLSAKVFSRFWFANFRLSSFRSGSISYSFILSCGSF